MNPNDLVREKWLLTDAITECMVEWGKWLCVSAPSSSCDSCSSPTFSVEPSDEAEARIRAEQAAKRYLEDLATRIEP
jgi:hypothetical protein